MNIEARKILLVRQLLAIQKETVLEKVEALLNKEKTDWWDEVSAAEKAEIQKGIDELERGESVPHQNVLQEVKEKYGI